MKPGETRSCPATRAGRVVAPDLCVRPARDGVSLVGAPGVAALTTLRMAGAGVVGLTDELSCAL
jgi:hypothetical protein